MAINRYDKALINRPVSNYIPLPFSEINAALGNKQKGYDENLAQAEQLKNQALQLRSIKEHDPYRIAYVDKVNNSVDELITKHHDIGSPEFYRDFRRVATEHAGDKNLQVLSRSLENYKNQQQHTEKLKKEGKYANYNDPYAGGFQGLDQEGNPLEYNYNPYEASEDHSKPVYTLFDKMKPSGSMEGGFNLDQEGNIISVKRGYEGIAQKFIDWIAGNNVGTFLNSPEGQDFQRKAVRQGGIKDAKELQSAALDYMRKIGSAYIFGKSTEDADFQYAPSDMREKDEEIETETVMTDAIPRGHFDQYKAIPPLNLDGGGTFEGVDAQGGPRTSMLVRGASKKTSTYKLTPQQEKIYKKAELFLGQAGGTEEAKADILNKYLDKLGNQSLEFAVNQFTDIKEVERNNRIYFGTDNKGANAVTNKSLKLMQGEGDKQLTGKQLLKEYGNQDKYNVNVTGTLTTDNPYFPAGKQITVTDKKGEVVAQYAMEGSREEQTQSHLEHQFYRAKYEPTGEHKIKLKDLKGKEDEYTVDYQMKSGRTLSDDGTPQKESEVARLLDKSGKVLLEVEDPYDAIGALYRQLAPTK